MRTSPRHKTPDSTDMPENERENYHDVKSEIVHGLFREPNWLRETREEWISSDQTDKDRMIVHIMLLLEQKKVKVTPTVVRDQLTEFGREDLIEHMDACMKVETGRTTQYMLDFLRSQYNDVEGMRILNEGMKMIGAAKATDALEWVEKESKSRLVASVGEKKTNANVTNSVFRRFEAKYLKRTKATWSTGHAAFDENIPFAPSNIILFAAREKVGKTRVVRYLTRRMLRNHHELRMKWFHFEQSIDEMYAMDIAMETGISTDVIKCYRDVPDDKQFKEIMHCEELLERLPIEHYGNTMTITDLRREVEADADERTIVVIDNLGLIRKLPTVGDGNPHDDMVSAEIKDMRDKTGALIIPIHHLTKATDHFSNRVNQYMPSFKDVRGSGRITDYANATVLMHRVSQYEDLEKEFGPERWARAQNRITFKAKGRDINGEAIFKIGHKLASCTLFDVPMQES